MESDAHEIAAILQGIVATRLRVPPADVPLDRNLMGDLGLDSMDLMVILLEIEERFEPLCADKVATLRDVAEYFARPRA